MILPSPQVDTEYTWIVSLIVSFALIVVLIIFAAGSSALESDSLHFCLFSCVSLIVFLLFCFITPSVPFSAKCRWCLGGFAALAIARFVNDLLADVATAADQRVVSLERRDCAASNLPICIHSLPLDIIVLTLCAIAEELWKLLAVLALLNGPKSSHDDVLSRKTSYSESVDANISHSQSVSMHPSEVAIYGASAGFGFSILENILYFRQDASWRVGLGRSVTTLHALLTALAAAVTVGEARRGCWVGVLVAGLFHAANNVAVSVVEVRLEAVVVSRVLVAINLVAVSCSLYVAVRRK